jgi:NAD kinase
MNRRVVVVYKSDNNDMGSALTLLKKQLSEFKPDFIPREKLLERDTRDALVIIAGGDGTFLGASHRILDNYSLVIGVKLSDSSRGYYTTTDIKGVHALAYHVLNHVPSTYEIVRLPRLECVMHTDSGNWVKTDLAVNEFFIANTVPYLPSRYILKFVDRSGHVVEERQMSSGVVVSTKQGYSGWSKHIPGATEQVIGSDMLVMVREPMDDYKLPSFFVNGICDKLFITSEMHRGFVVPDAFDEYHFNRGAEIEVRMSDRPLNIVRRKVTA